MTTVQKISSAMEYGTYDLWELYEYGERVSCGNPITFLHFLLSRGTRRVEVMAALEDCGVSFRVTGPIGDDGEPGRLDYQLTAGEAREMLDDGALALLISTVAAHGERNGETEGAARVARTLGAR